MRNSYTIEHRVLDPRTRALRTPKAGESVTHYVLYQKWRDVSSMVEVFRDGGAAHRCADVLNIAAREDEEDRPDPETWRGYERG